MPEYTNNHTKKKQISVLQSTEVLISWVRLLMKLFSSSYHFSGSEM